MFKRSGILAAAVFVASVLPATAADLYYVGAGDIKAAGALPPDSGIPAATQTGEKTAVPKDWTVMIFMNGKNNLATIGFQDIAEMEKIGSSDKVNIVAEFGRMNVYDNSDGGWKGVRRYHIEKGVKPGGGIFSPVAQDLGEVDMGDYRNVVDFGKWAKANYPAKHYILVLWNHGSGWMRSPGPVQKGISYDAETGSHVNTPQMAAILKEIGGVDVYASDACLMQMPEVDYEIKDYAQYIVGSEDEEPGDGWTYDTFFGPIVAAPAMSAEEAAKTAVNAYVDHYDEIGRGATMSYVRTSALTGLLAAVREFYGTVIRSGDKALVLSARRAAQKCTYPEHRDLYNFTQLIVAGTRDPEVKRAGAFLMDHLAGSLVGLTRNASGLGEDYSNAHGLAIYVPPSDLAAGYTDLQWTKDSGFDKFISWYQQP